MRVAVAGNPNVGKTSLFNVLTGSRHQVGNYPGVTVECLEGRLTHPSAKKPITLVDLPGAYSLTATSADEALAFEVLSSTGSDAPDAVLVVVDASNLARNLYFVLQLLELGKPVVVALNMVDAAEQAGIGVDAAGLERELGVPVVPTIARTGDGVPALVERLDGLGVDVPSDPQRVVPGPDQSALRRAWDALDGVGSPVRTHWLVVCGAADALDNTDASASELAALQKLGPAELSLACEQLVALRYARVDTLLGQLGLGGPQSGNGTGRMGPSQRLDRVLTHRVWGLAIFIAVMSLVFVSIFSWADPLMGWIEAGMGVVAELVEASLGPGLLTELLTEGVVAGVGNVLVFVPQIALLFLFIGLLEDSGYLARAAFLLDRLMARLGLHGRAFIPLLSGYACAIPAILGARTISSFKDRMVTTLMIPFMSCSARLPIYGLIIGALFVMQEPWISPNVDRGLILLSMYALSTVSALAAGFVYKRTILRSPTPPLVLELPPYRVPRIRNTLALVFDRTRDFVRNAGTVILAFTLILWALLSFPREAVGDGQDGPKIIAESYGGRAARTLEPVLEPMGQDWRIGVGIIGSLAAREVLVSTLGTVYGMEADDDDPKDLRAALREDVDPQTGKPRHTPISGLALMVFFVYACQCMSTLAVVQRETGGWRWPLFMFLSMTTLAYVAAVLVFQVVTALA